MSVSTLDQSSRSSLRSALQLVLIILGLSLILGGILWHRDYSEMDGWKRIKATIIDVSPDSPTVIVRYTANTNLYTPVIVASGRVNDQVDVIYNPREPSEAKAYPGPTYWPAIITSLIGLTILAATVVWYLIARRRARLGNAVLKQTGQRVDGILRAIQASSDKKGLYRAVVVATDPAGTVRQFISNDDPVLTHLTGIDSQSLAIPVDVYLDPARSTNYYVDLSKLKNRPQQP